MALDIASDLNTCMISNMYTVNKMALDIASGLKYMHDLKYVHRITFISLASISIFLY